MIVEGDSLVVIEIARRLQNGVTIGQVSKKWQWECRLTMLRTWLRDNPALIFLHVKQIGNRVADALANEGVGKVISFHAEENNDKRDGSLWRRCEALTVDDIGRTDGVHPQQLFVPSLPM